jgi:hypothetical protein
VSQGRAALLMYSSRELNLLVLGHLDGTLVEGTRLELDEDTHAQAGKILKTLHSQELRVDDEYEAAATAKALTWLDREHRIDQEVEGEVRRRLAEYRPRPSGNNGRASKQLSWPDTVTTPGTRMSGGSTCSVKL